MRWPMRAIPSFRIFSCSAAQWRWVAWQMWHENIHRNAPSWASILRMRRRGCSISRDVESYIINIIIVDFRIAFAGSNGRWTEPKRERERERNTVHRLKINRPKYGTLSRSLEANLNSQGGNISLRSYNNLIRLCGDWWVLCGVRAWAATVTDSESSVCVFPCSFHTPPALRPSTDVAFLFEESRKMYELL